jgi:DNA-binding HxlR family transcriptional regulator/putative sterol carrier protein
MESQVMSGRRSYGQYCALARALDIVGERWTLLLVRELLLGPRRYTDLLDGLPGIGTNLLARRLRDLEQAGIIERQTLPPPADSAVYALTRLGRALEPAVAELARFGAHFLPAPRQEDTFRPRWAVVGMKHTFRAATARGKRRTYQLHLDHEVYRVRVTDGVMHAHQGEADDPDLVIRTRARTLLDLLGGQLSPNEAVANGALHIEGTMADLEQFVRLFGWRQTR